MHITYEDFEKVDIRLGKIIDVQDFPETHKPAFKLKIEFGQKLGTKTSSVQLGRSTHQRRVDGYACTVRSELSAEAHW